MRRLDCLYNDKNIEWRSVYLSSTEMNKKSFKIVAYSSCVYLVLSMITLMYFYSEYQKEKLVIIEQVQNESTRQLAYTHHEFDELLTRIQNTLGLLSDSRPVYDYFLYPSNRVKAAVESSWVNLVKAEKFFSQLELMDNQGIALFSLSYNAINNETSKHNLPLTVVNHSLLTTLSQLPAGQVFSEGVVLNEKLATSGVYKPVMQIIIPIEVLGSRKGYVVAELSETRIENVIKFSPTLNISPSIVNQDGYYLLTNQRNKVFGHLVNGREDQTLKAENAELWRLMSTQKIGSAYIDKNIFSFYKFALNQKVPNKEVYFLLDYSEKSLNVLFQEAKSELIEETTIVLLLLSLIVLPCGVALTLWDKSNIESQLAKSALEGMTAVVITDKHQRIIKVNSAFSLISGYCASETIGKTTFDVLKSDVERSEKRVQNWKQVEELGVWQGEIEALNKYEKKLSLLVRIQVVKNKRKDIQYYILSYIDITQRKLLEKELRYLSEKDSLSDCWNRRKFEFELENQTLLTNRYYPVHQCCLAILDIDWFKRINDTKGHDVGDKVICLVADILQQGSRDTDFVARIGGEEFAIIMPHTELKDAERVVNRLRVAVSQLEEYQLTISGGLADIGIAGHDAYKCADLALYESKTNGRNLISICSDLGDLA